MMKKPDFKFSNLNFSKVKWLTSTQYLMGFFAIVAVLAVIRFATSSDASEETIAEEVSFMNEHPNRIWSVPSYKNAFPDNQDVQIVAANKWGVKPVKNREDAERRMKELVYIDANPYFHVDKLKSSIPYLVPRAAVLLEDIGQSFYDSLYMKGVPLNSLIVTSVLRTMEDVKKLQRHNVNATDNSCHLYGTTFDICYNRYHPVIRYVRDDTLKWVLSEVLRDKREEGRCYIKYEVKQGCFHITVR